MTYPCGRTWCTIYETWPALCITHECEERTMIPAIRTQIDGLEDEASMETGISFEGTEAITRQEFRDEADINIILSRFGAAQQRTDGIYTDTDYTLDLQQAFAAVEAAQKANLNVPPELRDKYPSWKEVLTGAESGEYERDLILLEEHKAAQTQQRKAEEERRHEVDAIRRRQWAERQLKREREDLAPPEE